MQYLAGKIIFNQTNNFQFMNRFSIFILLLLLTLMSCMTYKVSYTVPKGTDFKKYKTYAFLPDDPANAAKQNRQYITQRIVYYCDAEMKKKGLTLDLQNPDLVIRYTTYSENKVEYQYNAPPASVSVGFGGPGYYMGYSQPVGPATITQYQYTEGTLHLDMFEAKTNTTVWSAWTSSVLNRTDDIDDVLSQAIKEMYYTLPIKASKKK